jgi:hypothetical protein
VSDESPTEEFAFVGDITDYWTYTQVRDRLLFMRITDPARHMYQIARSMIVEPKKNMPGQGLRRMTIDQMCFLLTRDSGKPVSHSLMYQILSELKDLDLMVPLDTKQGLGSSQMKGKEKAARGILRGYLVRDLPPVPYTGWRNAWDKLNHYRPDWRENPPLPPVHEVITVVDDNGRSLAQVTQRSQDAVFQDSGTEPEAPDQDAPVQDPFQDSGTDFQDSGTAVQDSGTDSPSTSEDAPAKQGPPTTLSKKGEASSTRSVVDGRRPSDRSSAREVEGGCAASSKDHPAPEPRKPRSRGKSDPARPKHTRQQLDIVRAVRAHFPPDLLNGWTNPKTKKRIPPLPDVWELSQAILEALAGDVPAADRTVAQLGARIERRWNHHGWATKYYAGAIDSLVGAAVAMVQPLKASDRYGCGNPRCEDGTDVDTGEPCLVCPERLAARQATHRESRALEGGSAPELPAQRAPQPYRECACGDRLPAEHPDTMCPHCRRDADDAEETARLRAQLAARFGTPDEVDAYCNNAPF